jgi:hypothetical protein
MMTGVNIVHVPHRGSAPALRHGVDAVLPKSHVRLRPRLFRAGPDVSSVQRLRTASRIGWRVGP